MQLSLPSLTLAILAFFTSEPPSKRRPLHWNLTDCRAECNVPEGTTLTIKGRVDDLGLIAGKASSVTCYKGDLKKRQVDTSLTLCKQRRCLGQNDHQLTVDLTFGQCCKNH